MKNILLLKSIDKYKFIQFENNGKFSNKDYSIELTKDGIRINNYKK